MLPFPVVLRRRWLVFLGLILTIALSACNFHQFRTEAAQGSQFVISTLGNPKTFNFAFNQEFPNVFIFTHEGLVNQNGVTAELEPELAESWQFSENKKHVIFTLRPGLKWSDGQPLTAADVVFTFQDIYLNAAIPTDIQDGLKIGVSRALPTVKALDDRRIEFTLPEPFSPFLSSLSDAAILPAHSLQESVQTKDEKGNLKFLSTWGTDTDPQKIVVAGPYTIAQYVPSQRVIFRRNPHYWRKDSQGKSLPYFDRIVWQIVESTDTQLLKFRSGDMDGLDRLSPNDFSLLKRGEKLGKYTIYEGGPRSGTNFISFNLNRARNSQGKPLVDPIKSRWFNNKAFRQAVAYAIDRPKLLNNVFQGIGALQDSPVSVQSSFYLSPAEGLKVYDHNLEKAKNLLRSAGFQYNRQGQLLDALDNRVQFTLITNSENKTRVAMAAQIKQDLQKLGIQVDFNPISFNTLTEKLSSTRDWECYLLGFTGGVEPNDGANIWTSKGGLHSFNQGPQPGEPPIQGWQVSEWEQEIDRLFIAAAREFDPAKRKALYAQYQQIVQEELPSIHLITTTALAVVRDRIQNVKFSGVDRRGIVWNLYELREE
ncbi:MAG: ABC transporter substrate-binding protein [Scytolyngbya sp. HA4215-MV1]|jgi:peptide/nickel transport system substrate-binding protein|nr:ABC transporter substrate-binding protein [Scytolyngbya sp. HA4215-MV1]